MGRQIHPTAIIAPDVRLGANVRIGAYTVIHENVTIGDDCYLAAHVVIGEEAEHSTNKYELHPRPPGRIVIGNRVVLREFVSVTKPVADLTWIGDDVYVMAAGQIAHDVHLEAHAVVSKAAVLAGWTRVLHGANIGMCAAVHQGTTVGAYAMVAANATVVKDVYPLAKFIPGKPLGVNAYAIRKWQLPLAGENLGALRREPFYQNLLADFASARSPERAIYEARS